MSKSDSKKKIRIGTRATPLAIKQAEIVAKQLVAHNLIGGKDIEIIAMKSAGDLVTSSIGPYDGKGLFTKEIDQALLDERVDIAAHSLKDVESNIAEGISIFGTLEREDPRDALVTINKISSIDDLKNGCLIGTSAPRREAIIRSIRKDIKIIEYRGNFETRVKKLENCEVDATFLAMAGIKRLTYAGCNILPLPTNIMIPAAGQGIICLLARKSDNFIIDIINKISHQPSYLLSKVERVIIEKFEGSCYQPIAVFAQFIDTSNIEISTFISDKSGAKKMEIKEICQTPNAYQVAGEMGEKLLEYYNKFLIDQTIS